MYVDFKMHRIWYVKIYKVPKVEYCLLYLVPGSTLFIILIKIEISIISINSVSLTVSMINNINDISINPIEISIVVIFDMTIVLGAQVKQVNYVPIYLIILHFCASPYY